MSKPPNILVVHADQHRYDCLGVSGNPDVRTPHIDSLAADSIVYQESFCTYPVCTPSRYSLLTGLSVRQHQGWSNRSTLPPGLPTFPEVLRDAGYRTKAVGKMHFTPTYADVGFDELVLAEQNGPGRYDDDYHRWLRSEGLADRIDLMDQEKEYRKEAPQEYWDRAGALQSNLDEAHYSTTWIADRALETVQSWDGGGHLLMVGFIKPHHPLDPPAPWSGMYNPEELSLLPGWTEQPGPHDLVYDRGYIPYESLTEMSVRGAMAHYYATVSQIDHHVGRMVEALKSKGLYDETLVLYTSDHGDYLGFHHLFLKGSYMYDPLVKVPLIVKYPHQSRAGETSEALISAIDLAPTLLSVAGCDMPDTMRGYDLTRLEARSSPRELIFAEAKGGDELMVRSPDRKLLLCRDESRSQYFDLENDPLEFNNLFDDPDYREEVEKLRGAIAEWLDAQSASPARFDERRPTIRGDNVPAPDDGHREEAYEYFRRSMEGA